MAVRFVLLLHVLSDSQHWDLMVEEGPELATWQLAEDPACLMPHGDRPTVPARRLPNHRRAYLDYEGPVSGNRGYVRRIDRGQAVVLQSQEGLWRLRLEGALLNGVYEIREQPPPAALRWLGADADTHPA